MQIGQTTGTWPSLFYKWLLPVISTRGHLRQYRTVQSVHCARHRPQQINPLEPLPMLLEELEEPSLETLAAVPACTHTRTKQQRVNPHGSLQDEPAAERETSLKNDNTMCSKNARV